MTRQQRQAQATKDYQRLVSAFGNSAADLETIAYYIRQAKGCMTEAVWLMCKEYGFWLMREIDPYYDVNC